MNKAMSPASCSSSVAGDHIGEESCVDMIKTKGMEEEENVRACYFSKRVQFRREMRRKEYPPPIPLLARTENLASHMPWVLKRHYTADGRLVLTEEKVRHHEYLRAHRSNGRLTLHLVPMDHHDIVRRQLEDDEYDKEDEFHNCTVDDEQKDENEIENENENEKSEVVNVSIGAKCLAYSGSGGTASCIFGVAISPIRPVHS